MTNSELAELQLKIHDKVLNFMSYQPRTMKEVEDKLSALLERYKKPSPSEKEIMREEILARMVESTLVDDAAYAQAYVDAKIKSPKSISSMKIKQFLYKKGVSDTHIEKALEKFSHDVEFGKAEKDAQKKVRTLRAKDDYEYRGKLTKFLSGKGYSFDIVNAVVDRVLDVK